MDPYASNGWANFEPPRRLLFRRVERRIVEKTLDREVRYSIKPFIENPRDLLENLCVCRILPDVGVNLGLGSASFVD
jgi:hypothetical protein